MRRGRMWLGLLCWGELLCGQFCFDQVRRGEFGHAMDGAFDAPLLIVERT